MAIRNIPEYGHINIFGYKIHSKIRCRFGGQHYDASKYSKVIKTIFFYRKIPKKFKSEVKNAHLFQKLFFSMGMI